MCGDVMLGRGIDQVLPHPSQPCLYETYMRDARGYVTLAEQAHGLITQPVSFAYPWGDALAVLDQAAPDVRLINLETSITQSDTYWPSKGINYRMHPANLPCLVAARVDVCALANNHVLDWGYAGLKETLECLHATQIKATGAGQNQDAAATPAVVEVGAKGRVVVFSWADSTSGVPASWAATADRPGMNWLPDLSAASTVQQIQAQVQAVKQSGDIVVASIHWGGNWGYEIPQHQRTFAHQLIDQAGVDVIHGHSSHHVKGLEVYRDKLILYGCGDFINDYEGIQGHEAFRGDLSLVYIAHIQPHSGQLLSLQMVPTQMRGFQVHRASGNDVLWLKAVLERECAPSGTSVMLEDNTLSLHWQQSAMRCC
jgi:poly-gamma-glutamate synthesis protein (capsule biosynthesis protein)